MKAPPLTERAVQRSIVFGLWRMGFVCHHSPNGSHLAGDRVARAKQVAALKRDGMVPGWPDLTVLGSAYGPGKGQVGFLEVKAERGGVTSPEQQACHELLERVGHRVAVVRSLDEVLAALRGWGWLEGVQ
jgi:hypothetical protein